MLAKSAIPFPPGTCILNPKGTPCLEKATGDSGVVVCPETQQTPREAVWVPIRIRVFGCAGGGLGFQQTPCCAAAQGKQGDGLAYVVGRSPLPPRTPVLSSETLCRHHTLIPNTLISMYYVCCSNALGLQSGSGVREGGSPLPHFFITGAWAFCGKSAPAL